MSVTLGNLGTTTLVGTPSATTVATKGLVSGNGIAFSTSATDVTIKMMAQSCIARNSSGQNVNAFSTAVLGFDTDEYDPYTMHDVSSNNSRIYAPVSGIYYVSCTMQWTTTAAGTMGMTINRVTTGPTTAGLLNTYSYTSGATINYGINGTRLTFMLEDDYVEVTALNGTSATATVQGGTAYTPVFSLALISGV